MPKTSSFLTVGLILLLALGAACQLRTLADFSKSDGSPFNLIDNRDARNVDYETLMAALNIIPAKYDFRGIPGNCGFYAEATRNELEARGIRSALAFAIVGKGPHCFNAFDTTDQGRIYADLTGGVLSIAEKVNGQYRFVRHLENQTQFQLLGYERDFCIFW